MIFRSVVIVVLGCLLAAGCGGKAGTTVKPPELSTNEALKAGAVSCSGKPASAAPFVIDLDSSIRADLEVQMKKETVVVRYDCKTIKVLSACHLAKVKYDYAGIQRIEDVVQIKSQDDLAANLPFSSGKLGGEISSGRALDLATVLVGKKTAVVTNPKHADLTGDECETATHYLAAATVGAYTIAKGQRGKVTVAAEVFKLGANGSSEATEKRAKSDGSLDACKTSDPMSEAPPKECGAPLRLELRPFVDAANNEATASAKPKSGHDAKTKTHVEVKDGPAIENPCPDGFVFSGGACTRSVSAAYLCNPKNKDECKAQCDKGSAESCYNFAESISEEATPAQRAAAYFKACDLKFAEGCAWAALYHSPMNQYPSPDDVSPKYEKQWRESRSWAVKGCELGSAQSCVFAGDYYGVDIADYAGFFEPETSQRMYERACKLGSGQGCNGASKNLRVGYGVKRDVQKGLDLLERACLGGMSESCRDLAEVLLHGEKHIPKDEARAYEIASGSCVKRKDNCALAAEAGLVLKKDDKQLFAFAKTACTESFVECGFLADFYAAGRGTRKDVAAARELWKKGCDEYGSEDSCKKLGGSKSASPKQPSKTKPPAKK